MDIPPGCKIEGTTFVHCRMSFTGEFDIPQGITSIGGRAFEGCYSLTGVNIPESVSEIGAWAFSGCREFAGINIPANVSEIGASAFDGCRAMVYAIVPPGCKVGAGAFPADCGIFRSASEYRLHLAKNMAADLDGNKVEVVGMRQPTDFPAACSGRGLER